MTDIEKIIKAIQDSGKAKLDYAQIGVGSQNILAFTIDALDIPKWDYFCWQLKGKNENVLVIRRAKEIRIGLPNFDSDLEKALTDVLWTFDKKFYMINPPEQINLTIIAKVTNLCNLDCEYCYDRPFRERLGHNVKLPVEKLDKLLDLASKYAQNINFIFHGGEPTLVGLPYIRKVCEEIIPKYPYANYDICIQTNGTLLNEEWFSWVTEYNEKFKEKGLKFGLGTSYNATAEDLRHTKSTNKLKKGEGGIIGVLDKMHYANEHCGGMGAIDVLTKVNHGRIIEIYEFYKSQQLHSSFNIVHKSGAAVENAEMLLFETEEDLKLYAKETEEYFLYWAKDQDPNHYSDRYASLYIGELTGNCDSVCEFGNDCVGRWLGVNSNGDFYPCDRALPWKYRLGNIDEIKSIDELFQNSNFMRLAKEREDKNRNYCSKCNIAVYCNRGCSMQDIDIHGSADRPNTNSCKIKRIGLASAFKTLCSITIDSCNDSLRHYFIENNVILPGEIKNFLTRMGITEFHVDDKVVKVADLDYTKAKADFGSIEFEVFRAINPPSNSRLPRFFSSEKGLSTYHYEYGEGWTAAERTSPGFKNKYEEDCRFEKYIEVMKKKADENSKYFKEANSLTEKGE